MKNLLLSLSLFACTLVYAQNDRMTPELLWDLGRVGLEAISDDGKSVLYGVTRYDVGANKGNRDLYIASVDGKSHTQVTDGPSGEYDGQFINGKIGYSMGGQFYLADLDGKNPVQLTNIEGGISGVKAYYSKERGEYLLLYTKSFKMGDSGASKYPHLPEADFRVIDDLMYRHWSSWDDYEVNHVCMTICTGKEPATDYRDLMRGEAFDSPLNPFGGAESYTLSPDWKYAVYESKKVTGKDWAVSTNSELFMVSLETGITTNLTGGMMGYDKEPKFSPDGSKLAWMSMKTFGYESDVNDIVIMDMESRQKLHTLVSAGLYDQYTFHSFGWKNNNIIYAGVPVDGTNQIFELSTPKKITATGKCSLKQLSSGQHNYNHFEMAGKSLVSERQDMNRATEIFKINIKKKTATPITNINDKIYESIKTGKVEKRMVKTSDGKEMLTWVIYPPDFDPSKKYPTLLYCQGGPQAQVSQFYSFRWNFQLMAANGYIIVAPNRRGLPGFGREWNEQISGDWGGQAMRDYLAAIDAVKGESYVDEDKLGCIGASYGGYSVYYLAGIHEKRFKAFISHCGLFDLESWYLTTEELFFANQDLGGPYWEAKNAESFKKNDPKERVKNWDTPMLVIHGGKDFRVPENQGMEAFQAAKLLGIPSKFLYFPNEGHWILKPQNGLVWHSEFFGWLDQWLK